MDRRMFLGMCAGGLATMFAPRVHFAQAPGRNRFVFVLLRGALDGLATVVPRQDNDYHRVRTTLALDTRELLAIDDDFALGAGLAKLQPLVQANELVGLQAIAIPYRTRSHFDAQAILETGLALPDGSADGWMNRLLQVVGGHNGGIAIAAGLPRLLAGEHPVATWSPVQLGAVEGNYLDRLHLLYRGDARLQDPFEAALQMDDLGIADSMAPSRRRRGGSAAGPVMSATAKLLRQPDGPNIAAVEFSGWDTHANQGTESGPLANRLGDLADGLVRFKAELGEVWQRTTIVVMTEFGRTAAPNGTRGTDHGTAGAGLVLGPGVGRSRVVTDWPGLGPKELYEARDLRPTQDTRAVLKGVLAAVFDLTDAQAHRVFPGSEAIEALHGVVT